jgi:hypothetical protein
MNWIIAEARLGLYRKASRKKNVPGIRLGSGSGSRTKGETTVYFALQENRGLYLRYPRILLL